ncbi:glycosyltransferase [Megalodesulfovibrio paquesii]
MNVFHLIDSLHIGGSESLTATLATAFTIRGHRNLVCGLGQDGPLRNRLDEQEIPTLNLDCPTGIQPRAMLRIGQLVRTHHSTGILTHHFRQLVHALPAATLLRRPLVHVEHDYHSYEKRPDIIRKMGLMAPLVHRFVFVSEIIKKWFVERLPQMAPKALAIPNGVDTSRFHPNPAVRASHRSRLQLEDNDFLIGSCARLEPVKGLDLLIQAIALLPAHLHGSGRLQLLLVGDGSQRAPLERLAAELGVGGRVHFVGMADNVQDWLNACDAYALTSQNEGLPLSLMEAMASGLPVVAVDVGSVARVVDARVGALVRERDAEAVAEALGRLTKNRAVAASLGVEAMHRIRQRYSWDHMVDQYLAALDVKKAEELQ